MGIEIDVCIDEEIYIEKKVRMKQVEGKAQTGTYWKCEGEKDFHCVT